jgi:hypothetical protein
MPTDPTRAHFYLPVLQDEHISGHADVEGPAYKYQDKNMFLFVPDHQSGTLNVSF